MTDHDIDKEKLDTVSFRLPKAAASALAAAASRLGYKSPALLVRDQVASRASDGRIDLAVKVHNAIRGADMPAMMIRIIDTIKHDGTPALDHVDFCVIAELVAAAYSHARFIDPEYLHRIAFAVARMYSVLDCDELQQSVYKKAYAIEPAGAVTNSELAQLMAENSGSLTTKADAERIATAFLHFVYNDLHPTPEVLQHAAYLRDALPVLVSGYSAILQKTLARPVPLRFIERITGGGYTFSGTVIDDVLTVLIGTGHGVTITIKNTESVFEFFGSVARVVASTDNEMLFTGAVSVWRYGENVSILMSDTEILLDDPSGFAQFLATVERSDSYQAEFERQKLIVGRT